MKKTKFTEEQIAFVLAETSEKIIKHKVGLLNLSCSTFM